MTNGLESSLKNIVMVSETTKAFERPASGVEGLGFKDVSVPSAARSEFPNTFERAEGNEVQDIGKLKDDYVSDIKSRSECPETIDDSCKETEWHKISPEENAAMREEFGSNKEELIKQWETEHGRAWPRYADDVYTDTGKLIRRAGDRYDAHHIKPLEFGGQNTPENITPLHALEHFDKKGVHAPNSAFGSLERSLGGAA